MKLKKKMSKENLMFGTGVHLDYASIFNKHEKVAHTLTGNNRKNAVAKLYQKQFGICALCGKQIQLHMPENHDYALSIDHIIPKSFGGTNDRKNLQLAHIKCNQKRGNKIIDKFPKWFGLDNHEII